MSDRAIALALTVWLAAVLLPGASGALWKAARAPQMALLLLTFGLGVAVWRGAPLRSWAWQVDVRWLVAWHITRLIGIYFLYLYGQNRLPYDFAVKGGWGDIAVATLAVLLLSTKAGLANRRLLLAWNTLGLVDIILVVATAARLAGSQPGSMDELRHLPLSVVATFQVPLIIVSHFIIFWRAAR